MSVLSYILISSFFFFCVHSSTTSAPADDEITGCQGGYKIDQDACFDGIDKIVSCEKYPHNAPERASCLCNQENFNVYFTCLNENRKCFQNTIFDASFYYYITSYQSVCDQNPYATSVITTPPIYKITQTIPIGACNIAVSYCQEEIDGLSSCSMNYAESLKNDRNYCLCQPTLIILNSRCEYDGNKTCLGFPAETTNLTPYLSCPLSKVTPFLGLPAPTASESAHVLSIPAANTGLMFTSIASATASNSIPESTATGTGQASGAMGFALLPTCTLYWGFGLVVLLLI